MTYQVEFAARAIRDLRGLPKEIQVRILSAVERAAADPARFFRRLAGAKAFRLRVGDYRVLADIRTSDERILIAHIGHRRTVYE